MGPTARFPNAQGLLHRRPALHCQVTSQPEQELKPTFPFRVPEWIGYCSGSPVSRERVLRENHQVSIETAAYMSSTCIPGALSTQSSLTSSGSCGYALIHKSDCCLGQNQQPPQVQLTGSIVNTYDTTPGIILHSNYKHQLHLHPSCSTAGFDVWVTHFV